MNFIFERFFPKFTQFRFQAIPQLSSENRKRIKLSPSLDLLNITYKLPAKCDSNKKVAQEKGKILILVLALALMLMLALKSFSR